VNVQDVIALARSEIIEEQVQVGEDIGETSMTNVDRIVMNLEKTILMIEEEKNVIPIPMPEQENANEVIIIYSPPFLSTPPILSSGEDRWGFFVKFVITIPSIIVVPKLLPHFPFPCEKVGGGFFFSKSLGNTSRLCKS
jgi:hypothetical protein